ncbi:MAG: hybrid sensor histidine kinase/response regulator [Deltaproteobacteria bacterium]|nr:hybrid sensor histidine kinase/response regulator [Deltaproteobacteria bacterium]
MPDLLEPVTSVHRKARLYVVDDDPSQREFLHTLLAQCGYDITPFDCGEKLLNAVFENPPDLVLLDVMLPGAGGYDICKAIKKKSASLGYIPVLLVSVLCDPADRIRGNQAGADDFISVPFVHDELLTRVQSLLKGKMYHDRLEAQKTLLQKRHKQLHELQKLKDDLVGLLVHDLKNPLAVICGNAELLELKKEKMFDDESRKGLKDIRDNCGRLLRMIDCFLDINRLENGKLLLNRLPFDMAPFLEKIVSSYESLAELKKIRLILSAMINVRLSIDPDLMERVFSNLVTNALNHTPEGGKIIMGTILDKAEKKWTFWVKDSGKGIPEKYHEKIFEKFAQVREDKLKNYSGAGLGLTFCKLAVEAHNGRIWLESEQGLGSTFWINLPL